MNASLLPFTMRHEPPKAGDDWCRIVQKKGESEAKVYIYDEIGFWGTTAKDFAAQLDELEVDTIHLHVNSPGGSVFDGLAIHSSLQNHSAKVIAHVDGLAASAASFIIQSADERVANPNAQLMIHDAKAYAGGNAAQMRKAADLLDQTSQNIADLYAANGNMDAAEYRKLMKAETWYTGSEAVDAGLLDSVTKQVERDNGGTENAADKWDLAAIFNYAGRDAAPAPIKVLEQLNIANRAEEAQSMGDDQTQNNKQTTQTAPPPAPQPVNVADFPALTNFFNNGQPDFAALNAHVEGLESFKKETIEGGRKNFVKALAEGPSPKIAATQIESMEEFALSLTSKQFENWKASMEAAPTPSVLQTHGQTPTQQNAPQNGQKDATAERIETLQEIVQSHRDSGMSKEEVEAKPSYKELQDLLASQNQA